jgi:hypothetical protein
MFRRSTRFPEFDPGRMSVGHDVEDVVFFQQTVRRKRAAPRRNVFDLPSQFDLAFKQGVACRTIFLGLSRKFRAHGKFRSMP